MENSYAIIADIISTLLFFYLSAVYFLTPRKGNRYVVYLIFTALYLIYEIPTRFFMEITYTPLLVFFNYLYFGCLIWILYKNDWKRKLLCFLLIGVMGLAVDLVASLFMITINPEYFRQYMYAEFDEGFTNSVHLLALLVSEVMNTVIALVYLIWIKLRKWRFYAGFLLLPVYQLLIVLGYYMLVNDFSPRVALIGLLMGIFNLLLDGILLYLLEGVFQKIRKEEDLNKIQETQRIEYAFYQDMARQQESLREIRHDFANQLQTAYGMMDEPENVDKVKVILEEMKERLEKN